MFFVTFLIIGMCTFFLGCNTDLDGQCLTYDVVEGVASRYKFTARVCTKCTVRGYRGSCLSYDSYDCYGAYVYFQYVGTNDTCYFQTSSESKSNSSARNSVKKYPIGEKKTLLDRSGSGKCMNLSTGMDTWIAGVTFLTLTGLVALLWVYFAVNEHFYPDSVSPAPSRNGIAMTSVVPGSPRPPTPAATRGAVKVAVAPRVIAV